MGHHFGIELVGQNNGILEFRRDDLLGGIAVVPDLGFLQEIEAAPVDHTRLPACRIGAEEDGRPEDTLERADQSTVFFPALAIPNVSSICTADLKRIVWLC